MTAPVYAALVHHPVRDREGRAVTAAVTNIDIHDLARSAYTFGLSGFFIVSPIDAQRALVVQILEHWRSGAGLRRMPHRSEALSLARPAESIETAAAWIAQREAQAPLLVATAARPLPSKPLTSYADASVRLAGETRPGLILFGTGHGLADAVLERADFLLEPIGGVRDYNHLSVRAAAAITLDRLFGARTPTPRPSDP